MTKKSALLAAAIAPLFSASAIHAATITWDAGGGASATAWYTNTNWNPDTASGAWLTNDLAVFDNAGSATTAGINMGTASLSIGTIQMLSTRTRVLTIGNSSGTTGSLTLNGTTIGSFNNVILQNASASALTLQNNETGTGKTMNVVLGNATTNTIVINGTGGIAISSNISGVGGITRTAGSGNNGVLTLSGSNSYTGVTAINVGALAISNNTALGSATSGNNTTIAATGANTGGSLQLSGGITSAENITITGSTETSGFNGAIRNVSGNNTLSGNIVLSGLTNGVRFDTAGGNLIFSGNISQTGSTQSFSLAPTTGSTITVKNAINNNGGSFQTLSSGVGGVGTTILEGVSGTGIGNTNVAQNSTLQLGVTDALNTTASLNIAAFGGTDQGTFNLNGFNQTVGALNSSASGANRIVRNNSTTTASTLTVGNGGGNGAFNGTIVNGAAATLALVKIGVGNQTLSGTNTYTGGTRIDAGTLTLGNATNTLANTGAVNVNGGTLALGTNSDTVGAVTLTSGSITGSGAATLTGTSYAVQSGNVSAILAGSAVALTKSTAGTVTLSGANTYTGATAVNAGTLLVNGSTASGSAVTVANTATLGGTGSIGGSVTVNSGGTLAPGASIQSLATGTLSLNAGSSFAYEIDNDAAATLAGDLTAVTGNLNLALTNDVNLNLSELGSGSWALGEKLTLISYTGSWNGGLFDRGGVDLSDGANFSFSGATWTINYDDTLAGSNFTGDLTSPSFVTITVVPEPTTLGLLAMGAVGLMRRRRVA